MARRGKWFALWAIPLLAALVFSACGAAAVASPVGAPTVGGAPTQIIDGGNVTVKVTWPGVAAGPAFDVVLDTHEIDLDSYDLVKLALLRTDDGREVAPISWNAPKGGHHRQGLLAFPSSGADGKPILGSTTRTIELIVRDVAGVPQRSFRWAL